MRKNFSLKSSLLAFMLFAPFLLFASHYRYGSISWTNTSGNVVTFKVSQAWRLSAFGNPAIGSTVVTDAPLVFGDGNSSPVNLTVTSVNPSEDWFYGEATIQHTYASAGTFVASAESCCRISTLQNNADGFWRSQTTVNVGSGNSSPVTTIIPIIDVPANESAATINIPATDPNGGTLSFRFSNNMEAASGGSFVQPPGLSINPTTGVMTFNTVGKNLGELYSTQIMISDGTALVPLDFIIRISSQSSSSNTPPTFTSPTPPNGQVYNVNPGQPVTFTIQASDVDPSSTVTITVAGAPVGSTFSPTLPTTGNPVSTTFSWTPTASDLGSYVLSFNASDNNGSTANTSVTINVSNNSGCTAPTFLNDNTIVLDASCGMNDGNITIIPQSGTAPYMYSVDGGATYVAGPDAGYTFSNLGAGMYNLRLKDANGCESAVVQREIKNVYGCAPACVAPTFLNNNQIVLDASCGMNDGNITIIPQSGTAPYMYSIDGGTTYVSGPDYGYTFEGLGAGMYYLRLKDANGCESAVVQREVQNVYGCSSRANGKVKTVATIADTEVVSTYPNPSKGHFKVQLQNFTSPKAEVYVFDGKGTLIQQSVLNLTANSTANFDLSRQAPGLYYIKIVSKEGTKTSKVLIQ